MKKRDAAMLFSGVTLLIAITLLIIYKKGFWWYVGAFLLLSPIAGRIGWAIGKEDTEAKEACLAEGGKWMWSTCIKS